MDPVFIANPGGQRVPPQNLVSPNKPPRPTVPPPELSAGSRKPAIPALPGLKLNLSKVSGDAGANDNAPDSPSSRSKTKVQRAVTEAGGTKRVLDGKDGPGPSSTQVAKRPKNVMSPGSPRGRAASREQTSTPPGSPRGSTAPREQTSTPPGSPRGSTTSPQKKLVKQMRHSVDLKTMAGLSPRRDDMQLPPSSPRAVTAGGQPDLGRTSDLNKGNALKGAAPTSLAGSAPSWRPPAHPDISRQPALPPPGHTLGDNVEALPDGAIHERLQDAQQPAISLGSVSSAYLTDFAFTACDYSQNGELVATERTSSTTSNDSSSITKALIVAELATTTKVEKEAVACFIAAHPNQASGSGARAEGQAADAGLDLLIRAQYSLCTELTSYELALKQETASGLGPYLNRIAAELGKIREALGSLPTPGANDSASPLAKARRTLTESLAAMEAACTTGLGMLLDESASRPDRAATENSQPERQSLPLTSSKLALLEELDDLMDKEIRPD